MAHQEEVRHDAAAAAHAIDRAGGAQRPGEAEPDGRDVPRAGRRERAARRLQQLEAGGDERTADPAKAAATENATRQSIRRGVISMLVAAAVLLVFNSAGLRSWARGLPGNAVTDVLVEAADRWHGIMQRVGFATAMDVVQDAVAEFREQPWPGTDNLAVGNADVSRDD